MDRNFPEQPHRIEDGDGDHLPARRNLQFAGTGVVVTDDSVNGRTVVTITGGDGTPGADGADGADGLPHVIQDHGTDVAVRGKLNFAGSGVVVTDDSVNGRTTVTISGGGGGGGGSLAARTTAVLAGGSGSVAVAPGFRVLKLEAVGGNARVRLYGTAAKRDADVSRDQYTLPVGDHGVMLDQGMEVDEETVWLLPPVDCYNQDATVGDEIYFTVELLDGGTGPDVTITYVATEAT